MKDVKIYNQFKYNLLNALRTARDVLVIQEFRTEFESLFEIANDKDKLYSKILKRFDMIATEHVERLIYDLCIQYGIKIEMNSKPIYEWAYDLLCCIEGQEVMIDIKPSPRVFDSARRKMLSKKYKIINKQIIVVYLVKNNMDLKLNIFKENDNVLEMTFEDFIFKMFGQEELDLFRESMISYKDEMHSVIGYQITEIFNESNLENLIEELKKYFNDFNYEHVRKRTINEIRVNKEKFNDLYDDSFKEIIKRFIEEQRFSVFFGNKDFAKSFITSEWLYKQYVSVDGLDNTFIVAGYLKSIEQLLWNIIHLKGQGRLINSCGEEKEISEDYIKTTLGDLEHFISDYSNLDLFEENNKFAVRYLKEQLSLWRDRYRNGYFHKHQLDIKENVIKIREETIFLYSIILGLIKFDNNLIQNLK